MNTVKHLRQSLSLSQAEFADLVGISQQHLSGVESGARPLSDRTVHAICTACAVSESWLRTGEGDMYPLPAEEDTALIELLGALSADDVDPRRKRIAADALSHILSADDAELGRIETFHRTAKQE